MGAARKHQFGGSTFGGVIGVVQIGEKESNFVGMDVSHSIGKRSSGVGKMKDGQIFCTYSFCIFIVQVEKDVPANRKRSANRCPATYKSTHSGCANIFKSTDKWENLLRTGGGLNRDPWSGWTCDP